MTTLHAMGSDRDVDVDSEASEAAFEPPLEEPQPRSTDLSVRFFEECGGNRVAQIHVEHHGKLLRQESLHRPFLLVGSDPRCHLCLPGEEIRPQHLLLQWIEGSIFCCDLSHSTAPVSAKKSPTIGRWLNQQAIEVGPYRLLLENFAAHPSPTFSPLDRQFPRNSKLPQIGLRFTGVSESDNIWKFDRTLVLIGKSPQCKLRLNHPTIANTQAWLLQTSHGAWLVDLVGNGSTRVNGRTAQIAPIDIGDQIQFVQFNAEVISTEFLFAAPPVSDLLTRNQVTPATNPYDKPLPPIRFDRPLENAKPNNPLSEPLKSLLVPFSSDPPTNSEPSGVPIALPTENFPVVPLSAIVVEEEFHSTAPTVTAIEEPVAEEPLPKIPVETAEIADGMIEEIPAVHVETIAPACEQISLNTETAALAAPVALPIVGVRIQPSMPASTKLHDYQSVNTSLFISEELDLDAVSKIEEIASNYCPAEQPSSLVSADVAEAVERIPPAQVCETVPTSELPTSIGEFIEAQRAEIARLRSCLNEFQLAYEGAAGSLISRKTRDALERPVLATTNCCDTLIRNLDQFTAAHNRTTK